MMGGMTGRPSPVARSRRRPALAGVVGITGLVALVLPLGACSTDGAEAGASRPVVTSFYPLQYATQQIVGGTTPVTVLTKPGAEPHDLELAPQDIGGMTKARLVIYSDRLQPGVDEGVRLVDPAKVLDVADAAKLTLTSPEEGDESGDEGGSAGPPAADAHDHAADDPHFWL